MTSISGIEVAEGSGGDWKPGEICVDMLCGIEDVKTVCVVYPPG